MLKFNRPTLVIITAPTCSGKNFLLSHLENTFGWKRIVSTTTRLRRKGEVQGVDYYFIDDCLSRAMENEGKFAELVTFRNIRYGVTHEEMSSKVLGDATSVIVLEPQGLKIYKELCVKNNWDVFTIYISTTEDVRIQRLIARTTEDLLQEAVSAYVSDREVLLSRSEVRRNFERVIQVHTDRLLSITTEERSWSSASEWNAIVPGDDIKKALEWISLGVKRRNSLVAEPIPYEHKGYQ